MKLVPAQHVKAFCRVHKNDSGDALAITEAAQRPGIHFVPVETLGQQDLQLLGRVRSKMVSQRVAFVEQAPQKTYSSAARHPRAWVLQEGDICAETGT